MGTLGNVYIQEIQMSEPYSKFNGTTSQYKNLHKWIGNKFGRPKKCEDCGTTSAKRYDWATIDNKYTNLREDWKRLCRSCHQKFDKELFIGKRFSGKNHSEHSKNKTSNTMKTYWANNPEKYAETRRKAAETIKKRKALNG